MSNLSPGSVTKADDICIIIPTKNEQHTIGPILDGVKALTDHILIVDGRSEDLTLEEVKKRNVRYISDHGRGKGDALRIGVANTRQEIIVFLESGGRK